MVDRLVERGLLDRWEHPVDRRQRLVGVSPAGAALASRMAAARAEELQEGFARLDPELRARLADVFDEVIAQLRAGGDE
jgi:DNA-binding MarR family transcriptional regulator